jgi:hypothetical protein
MLLYTVRVRLLPAAQQAICMLSEAGDRRGDQLEQLASVPYSGFTTTSLAVRNGSRGSDKSRALNAEHCRSNKTYNLLQLLMSQIRPAGSKKKDWFAYECLFASCHLVPFKMHSVLEDLNLIENAVRHLRLGLEDRSLGCPTCKPLLPVLKMCEACDYCQPGLHDQKWETKVGESNITDLLKPKGCDRQHLKDQEIRANLVVLLTERQVRKREKRSFIEDNFETGSIEALRLGATLDSKGLNGLHLLGGVDTDRRLALNWPTVQGCKDNMDKLLDTLLSSGS